MNFKFEQLKKYINENVDGIILISDINRFWLLNFKTSFGVALVNKELSTIFITDKRYYLAAKHEIEKNFNNVQVWTIDEKNSLPSLIIKAKEKLKIDSILIEEDYINLSQYKMLNSIFSKIHSFNSKIIRSIKSNEELEILKKSAEIVVSVIEWLYTIIKPGMTEKEIARMISIKILELGADSNSFSPIVAAGLNGANPHHKSSDYAIQEGDFVTIDIGCMYQGFASDITRTFVIGDEAKNKEMVEIYNLVLKSQLEGIKNANNKINGVKLDCICRFVIDSTKYKGLFMHGTGHGVGMEVHEMPNVNSTNDKDFELNSVITIEPGIYKDGVGGVRIEDTIVITENKPVILTDLPKELKYVKNY